MSLIDKKRKSLPDESRQTVYSRILDRDLPVNDARAQFTRPAWKSARERAEVQAFLESKRQMVQSDPQLSSQEKSEALAKIDSLSPEHAEEDSEEDDPDDAPPPPGGVGYGIFYQPDYKVAWDTGSAVESYIVCPTTPGGNVSTWLYLTATNRTGMGVEAFVSYHAQDEFSFKVFDWARRDPWQVDRPYSMLADYVSTLELNSRRHQVLYVLNLTYQKEGSSWTNEVYLLNVSSEQLDLIYRFDYASTIQDQKTGWVGSWGPIVETFQDQYAGTHPMGFAYAEVMTRDASSRWRDWEALEPATTFLREDGVGFSILALNPNDILIVGS
jgi:hypothetical protein